jgi:hypothetical protein
MASASSLGATNSFLRTASTENAPGPKMKTITEASRKRNAASETNAKHVQQDLPARRKKCGAKVDDERNGDQPRGETHEQQETTRTLREAGDINVESWELWPPTSAQEPGKP